MEMEAVTAAHEAAQQAQQIILDLRHYPLVEIELSCSLTKESLKDYSLGLVETAPFSAKASIRIPIQSGILSRHQPHDAMHDSERINASIDKARELYLALGKLNKAIYTLANFDVIVNGSVGSLSQPNRINLAILKRFVAPSDPVHETGMRDSMAWSIWEMRDSNHRDLVAAEDEYERRFGEPCPERPNENLTARERLVHINESPVPNYNDLGPTKYAVPRL